MTQEIDSPDQYPEGSIVVSGGGGLTNLVRLEVRSPANRIGHAFPLDLRLEVDEMRLQIIPPAGIMKRLVDQVRSSPSQDPIMLRIRLRHCYVRYSCEGVDIPAGSKYRSAIELGGYSDRRSTSDKAIQNGEGSAGLNLDLAVGANPKGNAAVDWRIGTKWLDSHTFERTVNLSQDVYQVQAVPRGWRIGDLVHGDPVKHGGFLNGPYFAKTELSHRNTCTAEFHTGSRIGHITFDVTTRDGIHVERLIGATYKSDVEAAVAAMRDKLAAICIERHHPMGTDELMLQTLRVSCTAGIDGDAVHSR